MNECEQRREDWDVRDLVSLTDVGYANGNWSSARVHWQGMT